MKMKVIIENGGQGHGAQHLQWAHSMANINIYQHYFLHLLLLLRYDRANDCNTQTHKEINKVMAIVKIANLNKNYDNFQPFSGPD